MLSELHRSQFGPALEVVVSARRAAWREKFKHFRSRCHRAFQLFVSEGEFRSTTIPPTTVLFNIPVGIGGTVAVKR
jgi:hypothetical protein